MKKVISNALQIMSAVIITGSLAYAMEAPKQPIEQFHSEVTKTVQQPAVPTTAPEAVESTTVPEPVVVHSEPETQAVEAVSQPEPVIAAYSYGSQGDWFIKSGISQANYRFVDYILLKESGWCPYKWQGEHGACPDYHGVPSDESGLGYGLCQSTPASKMAAAGADWATNPVTQLKWCDMHANSHHNGWADSYQYWIANSNW